MSGRTWRFLIAAIVAVVLVGVLTLGLSCSAEDPDGPTDKRFDLQEQPIDSRILMDRVTGVYYLVLTYGDSIAVTPLLNIDGLPLCVDDANHGDMESALADIRANTQAWMRGELYPDDNEKEGDDE